MGVGTLTPSTMVVAKVVEVVYSAYSPDVLAVAVLFGSLPLYRPPPAAARAVAGGGPPVLAPAGRPVRHHPLSSIHYVQIHLPTLSHHSRSNQPDITPSRHRRVCWSAGRLNGWIRWKNINDDEKEYQIKFYFN